MKNLSLPSHQDRATPSATTMQPGDLVLVTGITGYLASWIARYLLEDGFRVRGTVRTLSDVTRLDKIRTLLPGAELVEADLRRAAGWEKAVEGCKWVFHVASPQAVKTETDRTSGAVEGTQHVLRTAFASGAALKVVVTSSVAAIAYGHPASKRRFDESDWTQLDGPGVEDYFRSKTLAEKLAWELARDTKLNPRQVAVSTVNPGLILGPTLVPWGRYSVDTLKDIAEGKMAMLPDMSAAIVDVRDCARMHIAVMRDRSTDGRRHLSIGARGKFVDIAKAIRDGFADRGFNPPLRLAPRALLWALKFFNRNIASIYSHVGHETIYAPETPRVYPYRHTDFAGIVRDAMNNLIEQGGLSATSRPAAQA